MIEHAIRSNERGEDWLQATQSMEKANKILVGQMQQLYPDLLEKQEYLEAYNQLKQEQPNNYAILSWTACYNDNCATHLSDKQGLGYYPRRLTPYPKRSQ